MNTKEMKAIDKLVMKLQEEGISTARKRDERYPVQVIAEWIALQKMPENAKATVLKYLVHQTDIAGVRISTWEAAALVNAAKQQSVTRTR